MMYSQPKDDDDDNGNDEEEPRFMKLTRKPSLERSYPPRQVHYYFTSASPPEPCQPSIPGTTRLSGILISCVVAGLLIMSRTAVQDTSQQVNRMENNRHTLQDLVRNADTELNKIKRELDAVDAMLRGDNLSTSIDNNKQQQQQQQQHMKVSNLRALTEMKKLQQRVDRQSSQAASLKQRVQQKGVQEVKQTYGADPIHVLFELQFPDNSPPGPNQFVVELAPVEVMPHSIQTFLAMVSGRLWDDCSFILNALQVVKAAPLPYDRRHTSAKDKARQFSEAALESVAFREYNPDYPHKAYTLAFAADGSPSFYINTADNTELHMGDPCFGTVVWGIDAIQRLEACPLNGVWFKQRVGIKSVRVMSQPEKDAIFQQRGGTKGIRAGGKV